MGDILGMKSDGPQQQPVRRSLPGSGNYQRELTRASSQDQLSNPQYNAVAGSVDYGQLRDFERAEIGQEQPSPQNERDFRDQYEDFARAGPVRPQSMK